MHHHGELRDALHARAFRPSPAGEGYHDLAQVERDFAQMDKNRMNAVRIPHTMPPRELLDIAQLHGLRVMVGLSAEQYVFLDLISFNVYLEDRESLESYLARLHNIAGDRPLLMSEVGLDSLRNGEDIQAEALDWQIRATLTAGCAGAFIFAWTDE